MKRKIIFSVLWAGAFALAALLMNMVLFAILGFAGIASRKQPTAVLIGRCLSYFSFTMPVIGLILGLRGLLPGTRKQNPQAQS